MPEVAGTTTEARLPATAAAGAAWTAGAWRTPAGPVRAADDEEELDGFEEEEGLDDDELDDDELDDDELDDDELDDLDDDELEDDEDDDEADEIDFENDEERLGNLYDEDEDPDA